MRKALIILLLLTVVALVFFLWDGGSIPISVERWIHPERIKGEGMEANARGVQELSKGKNDRAVASLRMADGLEPGNPVIRRNLSIALARAAMAKGREEKEALGMLGESLALWPQNPEGLDGMSTLHFRNARYLEALEYAEKLRQTLPSRPDLDAFIEHLRERAALVQGMVAEEGDQFRLLYSGRRRLEYEGEILAVLQTEMDALTVALGIFPEDPVDVLILTGDLGDRSDPFLPFIEGLYDGQIRLFFGDGIGDRGRFIQTVRHEMVHALLHQVSQDLPGWFHEGIAQKVGEDPDEEIIGKAEEYVREALDQGYAVNLQSLDGSFVTMEGKERSRAYATSLLFMDWMQKRFGESLIPACVSEIGSGTDAFSAIEKVTGVPFLKIQDSFQEYLTGDP